MGRQLRLPTAFIRDVKGVLSSGAAFGRPGPDSIPGGWSGMLACRLTAVGQMETPGCSKWSVRGRPIGMTGPINGGVGVWGRGLRLGVCSQATSALAPLDRRLRSGLIPRGPGQCAKPAPGTPEHRRRVCFFSSVNSGLDHRESGRSGQVARVPDSEDKRRWRPSWLRMRSLPPHIVGWPGPHDWGTIGGARTGRGIGSGGDDTGMGPTSRSTPECFSSHAGRWCILYRTARPAT